MKKIWLFLGIAVIFGAAAWFFAAGYDYKKIVFVLPSSERASSPYYYKKDGDFFLAQDCAKVWKSSVIRWNIGFAKIMMI